MWGDPLLWLGMLAGFAMGMLYGLMYVLVSFGLLSRVTRRAAAPLPRRPSQKLEVPQQDGNFWQQWRAEREILLNADTMPIIPVTEHLRNN